MERRFELPQETREIQNLARQLTEKYQVPLEQRMLQGEQLDPSTYVPGREAAKAAGLWGLALPESMGGADLSLINQLAITEEIWRCTAPLKIGGTVFLPLFSSNEFIKEKFLSRALKDDLVVAFAQTEPGGGSDPARSMKTRAVKQDDKWVINGNKVWITNAKTADLIAVVAVTDTEKRSRGGISMFAVTPDNPGYRIGRTLRIVGGREVYEVFFDDCVVEDRDVLGGQGEGFQGAQKALSAARFIVGTKGLGIAQRAYEMMVEHAKTREVFDSRLADMQAIQSMIVDSFIEIEQHRLLTYSYAEKADSGGDTRMEAAMIKMLGTELSDRVVDRAIQIHGAAGVTLDSPLAYWYGEQRPARIFEGPSEVHKYRVIARRLLS